MSCFDSTVPSGRVLAALISTLLAVVALGASAQPAGAVAALYAEVAEEMATDYAEELCREDKPECYWGYGSRCRQQGKFQVTCWAVMQYRTTDESESWECKRHIRYTAERRPYYKHKRVVKHRQFLGPWTCTPHEKQRDY